MIVLIFLATALSAGNAQFDKAALEGANDIAISRVSNKIAHEGAEWEILENAMLSAPEKFVTREEANKACREIYKALLLKEFSDSTHKIALRLGLKENSKATLPEESLAKAMELYSKKFDNARLAALKKQVENITRTVRPTEEEIEFPDEVATVKAITARVIAAQDEPIFEENRSYVSSSIVKPMIDEGRKELKRQFDYVMRAKSDLMSPSLIADDILKQLGKNIERERKKMPHGGWGAFPKVLNEALPQVVEKRMAERLVSAVESGTLEITSQNFLSEIAANPLEHVKASASEKIFRQIYSSAIASSSLSALIDASDQKHREEIKTYLLKRISLPQVQRAINARLRRDVMPCWEAARKQAAKKEVQAIGPQLADGTWYPNANLADKVCSRSDYAKAVGNWRKIEELSDMAMTFDKSKVMEETSLFADQSVAKAFDASRSAISAQMKIVESIYPDVLKVSRDRKESWFKKTPDLNAIIKMLTERTMINWLDKKNSVLWPDGNEPENAAEQHAELFPSVKKQIELVARTILEEMNEKDSLEDQVPEEAESEERVQEELLELKISVMRKNDNVEVKLEKGSIILFERTVPSDAAIFKKAFGELENALSKELGLK